MTDAEALFHAGHDLAAQKAKTRLLCRTITNILSGECDDALTMLDEKSVDPALAYRLLRSRHEFIIDRCQQMVADMEAKGA